MKYNQRESDQDYLENNRELAVYLLDLCGSVKTFAELATLQVAMFPNGDLCTDNGGQLLIYTSLTEMKDGGLEDYEVED